MIFARRTIASAPTNGTIDAEFTPTCTISTGGVTQTTVGTTKFAYSIGNGAYVGSIGAVGVSSIRRQARAHRDIPMVAGFKNERILSLQDHGESRCQIDGIESEGTSNILQSIILFFLKRTNAMDTGAMVPIAMGGIKGDCTAGEIDCIGRGGSGNMQGARTVPVQGNRAQG